MSGTKPKIYITRRIPETALKQLQAECDITQWNKDMEPVPQDELMKKVPGIDGLYCLLTDNVDKAVIDAAGPQLKVISTMSVGYDHIDTKYCKESGEWGPWSPLWLCGSGLSGSTVGIVGFGRIGMAVARRLKPFNPAKFYYFDMFTQPQADTIPAEQVDIDTLLSNSDFICVCCAHTKETHELFNKETFKKMKNSAILVNTSRGGVVKQEDVYPALTSGEIGGIGLDVTVPEPIPTDDPLLTLKNCVILPHTGSNLVKTRYEMAELAARNLLLGLKGQPLETEAKVF